MRRAVAGVVAREGGARSGGRWFVYRDASRPGEGNQRRAEHDRARGHAGGAQEPYKGV